jgi:hypothetical protein
MGMTDFTIHELLDHLHGKGSYTPPTIYLALSTTKPTNAGTGHTEPSGGSYARKTTAASDWAVASSRKTLNAAEISFVEATGDWGTIIYICKFDNSSGGNMLEWARLGKIMTTLNEECDESETTITLTDASGLPTSGTIQIEDEDITYTGKSTNDLTGCSRGAGGTTARAHGLGKDVFLVSSKVVQTGDTLKFAIGDLEFKVYA